MAQKIVVIGAGIIGANAAYRLQQSGADVTVIDAGLASATQASFGWINASFFENEDYFKLRVAGIAAHRDLSAELSLPISWSGCLCWEHTGDAFDTQRETLENAGYAVKEIDAATFAALEPNIATPPTRALWFEQEAAAESGALAVAVMQAAIALGARMITGVEVTGFQRNGDVVTGVHTNAGDIACDQVLVAAGTATQKLMAQLDITTPMLTRPALMLKSRPVAPLLSHVLASDIGEIRQLPCGAILMPAAISHQSDKSEALSGSAIEVADAALSRLSAMLPNAGLEWAEARLAYRPVPQDGMPVVGNVAKGVYVATMHSGITLAAVMGELIASEMLAGPSNSSAQMLGAFRPGRF